MIYQDRCLSSCSPILALDRPSIPDSLKNLSKAAIHAIVEYCETHKDLLEMEGAEELRLLHEKGRAIAPPSAR